MLDMYESTERHTIVQEPTNDEYDLRGTTYLPSLNIDISGGLVQQQTMLQNLNSSGQHASPCNLMGSIDRTNDRIGESDSDRTLNDESMDDDQSFDDDSDLDREGVAFDDGNVNYHSNVLPYLDYIEEILESCIHEK
ncbi:hypothetical protein HAX54_025719 [Datura stramonium]|uniref:Uncharacterized protein n=1 Tax=Datura stramonium TaxID=4076 RepID=A0ABS8S6R3_DATST|nr:hypothetical protein [Datura stramonium]